MTRVEQIATAVKAMPPSGQLRLAAQLVEEAKREEEASKCLATLALAKSIVDGVANELAVVTLGLEAVVKKTERPR